MIIIGVKKSEEIAWAIDFLEGQGYKVSKNCDSLIGKWAAFYQEGMKPVLHGKVKDISIGGCCTIRCKNGEERYVNVNDVIEFCDDKKSCYLIKNNI